MAVLDVVTPHIAFNSRKAAQRILETTLENLRALQGGRPQSLVTPPLTFVTANALSLPHYRLEGLLGDVSHNRSQHTGGQAQPSCHSSCN
jgi:hypothetical protein